MNKEKRDISVVFLIFSDKYWKSIEREITLTRLIFIICIACTALRLTL